MFRQMDEFHVREVGEDLLQLSQFEKHSQRVHVRGRIPNHLLKFEGGDGTQILRNLGKHFALAS